MNLKTKPKWIVFDVGGVLLEWRGGPKRVAKLLKIDEKSLLGLFSKYWNDMEIGKLTPETGFSKISEEKKSTYSGEKLLSTWLEGCTWLPQGQTLVNNLKNHYKLAVCSNNWKGIADSFWSKTPLFSSFDVIINSADVGMRKPNEEIYSITEKRLKSTGSNIFFVEDTEENIVSASNFGWQTFKFDLKDDLGKSSCDELREILL